MEKEVIKQSSTLFEWADTELQTGTVDISSFIVPKIIYISFLIHYVARLMFKLEPDLQDPPAGQNPFLAYPVISEYLWSIIRKVIVVFIIYFSCCIYLVKDITNLLK